MTQGYRWTRMMGDDRSGGEATSGDVPLEQTKRRQGSRVVARTLSPSRLSYPLI